MEELYLVTGAAGHLGNTIVRKLLAAHKEVRAFIIPGDHMPLTSDLLTVIEGNVCDKKSLKPFFANRGNKKTYVIHCAGIVSIASKYQQKVYDVNVNGTKNVLDLCLAEKVDKVVHVSSVHAIAELPAGQTIKETSTFDPDKVVGLYAKTKAEASAYALSLADKGLDISIVHPSGIIGPYDYGHGHLQQLIIDYMNHGLTAIVKGGYDFVDVRDVADGIIACCQKGRKGECYLLTNQYYSVFEIMKLLHEITGRKEIKTVLPMWFAKMSAPLAEIYYKIKKQPPLYTSYSLYTLTSNALFSHEKATKELNYQPRPLQETLQDTVDWLVEVKKIKPYKK